ncbi:uncharacterized protein LOC128122434 isoform X3 [Peromyscus californicus insignis]|uniref:uncharacterized protein LOC128122434 isoform X3 n=1 Tax=Peromyscus californicus insignis TaxID=564181 RepID=UPI0022A66A45|nr:uncharacterized protein LOC128122434 isoform X3 [Peromyscus californicus insignis]
MLCRRGGGASKGSPAVTSSVQSGAGERRSGSSCPRRKDVFRLPTIPFGKWTEDGLRPAGLDKLSSRESQSCKTQNGKAWRISPKERCQEEMAWCAGASSLGGPHTC